MGNSKDLLHSLFFLRKVLYSETEIPDFVINSVYKGLLLCVQPHMPIRREENYYSI